MDKHQKVVIFAMCIGIFLCMLDTTIMNIALPAIQSGLHVSLEDLSWALNIYTIVFAAFTIPFGRFADLCGRNKIYLLGLLVFGIGSIISGFAGNAAILITGRGIQSIGSAIVFPISMIIGISQVSVEKRTKAIAALGVTQGLAAALGPTIGGVVTQYLGWRWVFLINIPLILIALTLCLINLEVKSEKKINARVDLLGSMLSMVFLFALTFTLVKGQDWGWDSAVIIGLFIISVLSLLAFILYERRADSPMIPMDLFKSRQFNGSSLTIVLSQLFLVGVMVILPTFLTRMQNKTELTAALLITPVSLMIFVCSPLTAALVNKLGARFAIFTGFMAIALAYLSFNHLNSSLNDNQLILTCMLLGIGYGIIVGPITVLAASDFQDELLTASQSVAGVLRQIGSVLAVAIFVSGLTGNISQAKLDSIQYANKQIMTLSIPKNAQQTMVNKVGKAIDHERQTASGPAITKIQERSMVAAAYHQVLMQKHLEEDKLPRSVTKTIMVNVTQSAEQKVNKVNDEVSYREKRIEKKTKANLTDAFSLLYGWASPFTIASCAIAFLFKKKTGGFIHEGRRRDSGNH